MNRKAVIATLSALLIGLVAWYSSSTAKKPDQILGDKGQQVTTVAGVQKAQAALLKRGPSPHFNVLQKALQMPANTPAQQAERIRFLQENLQKLQVVPADRVQEVNKRSKAIADKLARYEREKQLDEQKGAIISAYLKRAAKKGASKMQEVHGGLGPDEYEPDNSHNQGEKLVDGFYTNNHNIYPAGDIDFFYFWANAGDVIEIVTRTPNPWWASKDDPNNLLPPGDPDLDPYLTLYLPDRTVLATDDDSGPGWDAFINIQLPVSGRYYISVQSSPYWAEGTIGEYEIGLKFIKPDDAEPDNDAASATVLHSGDTIEGRTIMPQDDADWYVFTVTKPGTALHGVIVSTPSSKTWWDNWAELYKGDLDPAVDLIAADGTTVLWTWDDTNNPVDPELGLYDAEMILPWLDPGTYYVRVRASDKATGYNTRVGSYKLQFDLTEPDQYEPDNSIYNANEISYGETIGGHTITSVVDGDMYKFEGHEGDFVDIVVTTDDPCGRLDAGVALFADGTPDPNRGPFEPGLPWLHSSMDDGRGLDPHILWGPLPYTGTYYIEVGADPLSWYTWWERSGSYEITLKVKRYDGDIPDSPATAKPLDFCESYTSFIPRTGVVWPNDDDVRTIPNYYVFEGVEGQTVAAKVSTPLQYESLCGVLQSDFREDLNPQVAILADDGATVVAMNKNIDPSNQWDDAQAVATLPYTGTYYVVVDAEKVQLPGLPMLEPLDSYGDYEITLMKAPDETNFDSDRNVGIAPLMVNFSNEDPRNACEDTWLWDLMVGSHGGRGVHASGPNPHYCYWIIGHHDVEEKAGNMAGLATELKENFVVVYGPSGYTTLEVVDSSPAWEDEPWSNAVDGDTYWWTGVATVTDDTLGNPPWAVFAFADGKTKMINKIRMLTDAGVGYENRWVRKFHVDVSVDSMTYTTILEGELPDGGWHEFVIDPPVEAKFVKLVVDEPDTAWRQIAEFEVYEDIVVPNMDMSTLTATTPHIANGMDSCLVTVHLVDDDGNPITTYDDKDIKFYLLNCTNDVFGPVDLSEADSGIYKAKFAVDKPGEYQVLAAAHGAVIKNDIEGDNDTPTIVNFFGRTGEKGILRFVKGSPSFKKEPWSNAVDGDREGWDGTATVQADSSDSCWAVFEFVGGKKMPFNKIAIQTDNGFDDDAYEGRQVRDFEVLISDDMVNWTSVLRVRNHAEGEYRKYRLDKLYWARYVELVIYQPNWGWRQIVEFEVLFDSKDFGDGDLSKQAGEVQGLPTTYAVSQNYPNPFNPTTTINFQLPEASKVTLKIYNTLGQEVATLLDTRMQAGYHSVTWNASNVPSGLYLYRFTAGSYTKVGRMLLLK